jgi:hypothetical protein
LTDACDFNIHLCGSWADYAYGGKQGEKGAQALQ